MSDLRWEHEQDRLYEHKSPNSQAIIFGAPRPLQLWAWAVYSHKHTEQGIAHSLRLAKKYSIEAIARANERAI